MEQSADITELSERLKPFAGRVAVWRQRALEINALAENVVASKSVDPEVLVELEQAGTDIRAEIAAFDKLVSAVGAISPASAAQLGSIGDSLRLVLLEITELGTRMYAVRWQAVFDTADAGGPASDSGAASTDDEPVHHVAPDEVIYLGPSDAAPPADPPPTGTTKLDDSA